ncbi:hypothetical protein HU200_038227 [Digitaria exilis]|uniref:Uncharacterized protein n=1 Tax=Digitaria exilis TaxID=1010633 RepID=A0A835EIM0_9POAL|nr:hypothetical protein HU200_038227 [Digitaria exilis]
MALNKSVIVVFLVVAFIQSISLCSFTCVGSAWPTPKPKPAIACFHAGSSRHPCIPEECSSMCEYYHHNGALAFCKSVLPGECCCPNENPCYHAGSSPHPCTTQGCSRMCQHYHHNGAMAYCKSISPGECCCPS